MSAHDFSLMLALLGGTNVLTSWIGHRTGDAARDVKLMLATGMGLVLLAGVVFLLG